MITPTESCSGAATWKVLPNMSGDGRPPMGWGMRTEVTKWERWPYSISSLVPLIIGVVEVIEPSAMPGIDMLSCMGVP